MIALLIRIMIGRKFRSPTPRQIAVRNVISKIATLDTGAASQGESVGLRLRTAAVQVAFGAPGRPQMAGLG